MDDREQRPVSYQGNPGGSRSFRDHRGRPRRGSPALARSLKPDVIFLDLILPDMTGFEILDRLKSDVETRNIPVIINTSRILDDDERRRLIADDRGDPRQGKRVARGGDRPSSDSLMKAGLHPPVTG